MAQVSLPYTLTAGTPENVNNLVANLNALVAGVNTIDTAQLASGSVTTAKIADANVTADKLGSTLAGQLGVSQTGTTRSVSVTQAAQTAVTSTTSTPIVTSSSLTVAAGGILRIVLDVTAKAGGTLNQIHVFPEINIGGNWVTPWSMGNGVIGYYSSAWYWGNYLRVDNTTYKNVGGVWHLPSGACQSATNAAQFRVSSFVDTGTAYLKDLTATMTYIAV